MISPDQLAPRQCSSCNGEGFHRRIITSEMASDAEEPSYAGQEYREQCERCHGEGVVDAN